MNITIIGTGYIGLTEGLCFADLGHNVICYDIVKEKIQKLQKGIPTLYEDGLEKTMQELERYKNIIDKIKKLCDENTNGIDDDGYDDAYYDRVYVREIEEIIEEELKGE